MDWVSVVLLVGIGLLTWRAYVHGFVRESVSLAAVVLAIPIAGIFYDDLYPKIHPIVDSEPLARLISFLAIFAGVVIAGQVGSHLMKGVARALNLGSVDRAAGVDRRRGAAGRRSGRAVDHGVRGRTTAADRRPPNAIPYGLPGGRARASESRRPPGSQAIEHPRQCRRPAEAAGLRDRETAFLA